MAVGLRKIPLMVDLGGRGPSGCRQIATDLFVPNEANSSPVLWCCVPGGGISRVYFDLAVPGSSDTYSMAQFVAQRGHLVLTIDPPGVGESDSPDDGYELTPQSVADVLNLVVADVLAMIGSGEVDGMPSREFRDVIGVGHSAGGLLVACEQARHRTFDALALLGFSGSGLPAVLTEEEAKFIDRPVELTAALPELVRARFGKALPEGTSADSDMLLVGTESTEAKAAAKRASSRLLGLVGLTSLIPGSIQPELNLIDVPTFVGVGEHDIAGPASALPAQLPGCRDLTLLTLAGVGHNHNVTESRLELWDRLERWVRSLAPTTRLESPTTI
jgi:pimeloyl-ACP methyl ester carboxylesterase